MGHGIREIINKWNKGQEKKIKHMLDKDDIIYNKKKIDENR